MRIISPVLLTFALAVSGTLITPPHFRARGGIFGGHPR